MCDRVGERVFGALWTQHDDRGRTRSAASLGASSNGLLSESSYLPRWCVAQILKGCLLDEYEYSIANGFVRVRLLDTESDHLILLVLTGFPGKVSMRCQASLPAVERGLWAWLHRLLHPAGRCWKFVEEALGWQRIQCLSICSHFLLGRS